MAAPQYSNFKFVGQSGTTYSVDTYISDVAGAMVNFDGGGGAGAASPTFWIAPENVTLVDVSIITGLTVPNKLRLVVNGKPLGSVVREDIHVSTNPFRPTLNIGFAKGSQVGAIQLSD